MAAKNAIFKVDNGVDFDEIMFKTIASQVIFADGKTFQQKLDEGTLRGPAGTNGAQGPTGPTGPKGVAGTNGSNGSIGPTGPTGSRGANGTNGSPGVQGPTGPTGPKGATGNNGVNGSIGPTGPTGARGPAGTNGTNGVQGPIGPTGPKGANGTPGANGAQGPTGPMGPSGATASVVSKSANGLCPILPNETTTTKYLRQDGTWVVPPDTKYGYASMNNAGIVKLNGTIISNSTTEAATASAVKVAYDKANHSHPYAASSHNHTSLTSVSNISFNSGMKISARGDRGISFDTAEDRHVIISAHGDITGVRILQSDIVQATSSLECDGPGSFKNVNATTHDSVYINMLRKSGVRAASLTSSDSGNGIRLHMYNSSGVWSAHYAFQENGLFASPRIENRGSVLDIGKEGDNSAWVAFYDTTKARRGYIGKGSSASNTISLFAEAGDYLLGASSKYGYSRAHFMPDADNTYYLGLTSPVARRWKQLIACTTAISTSDIKNKENVIPIGETRDVPTVLKARTFEGLNIPTEQASKRDYYEFIRDRFVPYSYNYKIDEKDESIPLEEQYKFSKSVGFIANEYDLENDLVAKEFIFKTQDGLLNYNTGNYTTVIAIALKEAIKEIELLKNEILALKQK